MLRVRFNVAGEDQYDRAFQVYEGETHNLREPLSDTADLLVRVTGEQFASEGAHGLGGRWQPLNPDYAAWKDEHYPGRPMLVRTGAMRDAYLVHGTRVLTDDRLVWGITDQTDADGDEIADRATGHQTGRGVVPQRKIIALNANDRRGIDRLFVDFLSHLRHRAFGGPR